jgi:hypothetical protein
MWSMYPQQPIMDPLDFIKRADELKKYLKESQKDDDKDSKFAKELDKFLERLTLLLFAAPLVVVWWYIVGWGWGYLFQH